MIPSSPTGMEEIPGGTPGSYYLAKTSDGLVTARDAATKCLLTLPLESDPDKVCHLVEPQTKEESAAIATWLVETQGVPVDSTAGFWTDYVRLDFAGATGGIITDELQEIRSNRTLFSAGRTWNLDEVMTAPEEVWRNKNQPGNRVVQDERCTAQKKPGQVDEFKGIDDYACSGHQLHYTVCEFRNDWYDKDDTELIFDSSIDDIADFFE